MGDDNGNGIFFTIGFCIGVVITSLLLYIIINDLWQRKCIKHGAAQYNPITAKFEWKKYE